MTTIKDLTEKFCDERGNVLAIVIRGAHNHTLDYGCEFATDPRHPLQVGRMRRALGDVVHPHRHTSSLGSSYQESSEALIIQKGRLGVTVFDFRGDLVETFEVASGDVVLLLGAHGIKFLEESEVIEVRTGPYRPDKEYLE